MITSRDTSATDDGDKPIELFWQSRKIGRTILKNYEKTSDAPVEISIAMALRREHRFIPCFSSAGAGTFELECLAWQGSCLLTQLH